MPYDILRNADQNNQSIGSNQTEHQILRSGQLYALSGGRIVKIPKYESVCN